MSQIIPSFITSGLKRLSSSQWDIFLSVDFNSGLKLTFRGDVTFRPFFETQITITV